jgi:inactivated superfamily I helicase
VIVAGSTGTIPATAELIATIARLPMGAVVLPGFDVAMDERRAACCNLTRTSARSSVIRNTG